MATRPSNVVRQPGERASTPRDFLKPSRSSLSNCVITSLFLPKHKGVEYIIRGLPGVVNGPYKDQHTQLFVAGGTHPNVLKRDGEKYRMSLERLTSDHGLRGAVDYGDGRVVDLEGNASDYSDVNVAELK